MLQAMAYYMPIYFISSYARRLRMTPQTGANLIAINNGLSALGKDERSRLAVYTYTSSPFLISDRQGGTWLGRRPLWSSEYSMGLHYHERP